MWVIKFLFSFFAETGKIKLEKWSLIFVYDKIRAEIL